MNDGQENTVGQNLEEARKTLRKRNWEDTERLWRGLIDKGFALISLVTMGKNPIAAEKGWSQRAVRRFHDIEFNQYSNAGVATGRVSNLIVLDVDNEDVFNAYQANHPEGAVVSRTFTVKTKDGNHYYYRLPDNDVAYRSITGSKQTEGFDIRAEGGYVVAPGSVHDEGPLYKIVDDIEIAEAPQWLLDRSLQNKQVTRSPRPQLEMATPDISELPEVDIDNRFLSEDILRLITEEPEEESDRSDTQWRVINALLDRGLQKEEIASVILRHPIGAKAYEKPDPVRWIIADIDRAIEHRKGRCLGRQSHANRIEIPMSGEDVISDVIVQRAFIRTVEILENYGNSLSPSHKEGILKTHQALAYQMSGELSGRVAIPLPPGYGKTTSVIVFIATLYELGLLAKGSKRIVLCNFKVEQLCETYRELQRKGVPKALIALVHSYDYEPEKCNPKDLPPHHASEKAVLDPDLPVALITHAKVMKDGGHVYGEDSKYGSYVENRHVVIWDEALISTDIKMIELDKLIQEVAVLKTRLKRRSQNNSISNIKGVKYDPYNEDTIGFFARYAVDYLEDCLDAIENHRSESLEERKQVIKLPEAANGNKLHYMELLSEIMGEGAFQESSNIKTVKAFLKMSDDDMVLLNPASENPCILRAAVVVPDDLKDVVILDASAEINEMMLLDRSINLPANMPDLDLSYENVTFHRIPHFSGRTSIERELATHELKLIDCIAEIVCKKPDESFLFFSFKNNEVQNIDCTKVLMDALKEKGIDLEAVDHKGRKLYHFLTHGNETASNDFSHCDNVVFVGLLHLSHEVLLGKILAQLRDICSAVEQSRTDLVKLSGICYSIHQGSCRSKIRRIIDDRTKPANVYYTYHNDDLLPMLKVVFPDAEWRTINSNALEPRTKTEKIARAIADFLGKAVGLNKVSNTVIKKALKEMYSFGDSLFTEAINLVSENNEVPWVKEKYSMRLVATK